MDFGSGFVYFEFELAEYESEIEYEGSNIK